jgi:hypothetical protein
MGVCRASVESASMREARCENGQIVFETERRAFVGEIEAGRTCDKFGGSFPQIALHVALRAKASLLLDPGTTLAFAVASARTLRGVDLVDDEGAPLPVAFVDLGAGVLAAEFPLPEGYADAEARIGPFRGDALGVGETDPLVYRVAALNEVAALFEGDVWMGACLRNCDLGIVTSKGLIGPVDSSAPPPRLRALSPDGGPQAGGFEVAAAGEGFDASSVVMVGDERVVPTSWSPGGLVFEAPAVAAPGVLSVAVVNEGSRQSSLRDWHTLVYAP